MNANPKPSPISSPSLVKPFVILMFTFGLLRVAQKSIQKEEMRPLVCEIPVNTSGDGVAATISLGGGGVVGGLVGLSVFAAAWRLLVDSATPFSSSSFSLLPVSMSQDEGITSDIESRQDESNSEPEGRQSEHGREPSTTNAHSQQSIAQATAVQARQRRRIAQLEEKLEVLESGRVVKQKQANYHMAQGRAIRRIVALFDSIEDLVAENDRRHEEDNEDHTLEQIGYITLSGTLPWFYRKGSEMEYDEYAHMLKMLRQGADSARGDNTSKLKALVAEWVNREFKPDPPVDSDDKHSRGFSNDACGRLLCPAELDWNNPGADRHSRSLGWLYRDGSLFSGLPVRQRRLMVDSTSMQAYKAVFTSPSSAKNVKGDGDGTDNHSEHRHGHKTSLSTTN
ncbi:hypothetical protein EDD22DRAFT_961062 [Suillus occidentalis]|nr:hypothetical protein EDD22DRAFT_961062 [Suillus occidentalis]